jgi:site-specific DNA-methyltransferase (adenine-specific)
MTIPCNTLLNDDCLNALPQFAAGSVDFILTDPPYITRYRSRDGRTVPNDNNAVWLKPAFAEMYRVLIRDAFAVSFYGWPQADRFMQAYRAAGFRVVGPFVFPKRYTSAKKFVGFQHECVHLLAKGYPDQPADPIGDVIAWSYTSNKLHPKQKTRFSTSAARGDLLGAGRARAGSLQRLWFVAAGSQDARPQLHRHRA